MAYRDERAPVNIRAWVVQERLLAPRVLHFGQTQVIWECRELSACELYPHGLPDAYQEWMLHERMSLSNWNQIRVWTNILRRAGIARTYIVLICQVRY